MNCLIIDDNRTIANIVMTSMKAYGFVVEITNYPRQQSRIVQHLCETIKKVRRDLIIMNTRSINPNFKLADAVKEIKQTNKSCTLFGIAVSGDTKDKISFLNSGGDDIITYPFQMQEFLARIQAQLRHPQSTTSNIIDSGDLLIDTAQQKVYENKKEVPLCRKEYNIIEYMVRNMNRPISRSELLDHVWDYRKITGSNTIDVHINRIRKKLNKPYFLTTVYGFGYKLMDKPKKTKKRAEMKEL